MSLVGAGAVAGCPTDTDPSGGGNGESTDGGNGGSADGDGSGSDGGKTPTETLIADGGPLLTGGTEIEGNTVTATFRNEEDDALTVQTVELERTEEQEEIVEITKNQTPVVATVSSPTTQVTELTDWDTQEVVEDLDLTPREALTSAAIDTASAEAITDFERIWKEVICEIDAETSVVEELCTTTKEGDEVVADVVKIIEHTKEFAEGHVQDIVADVVVESFDGGGGEPITDITPKNTDVVGDGDWETGEVLSGLEAVRDEFLTDVTLSTGSHTFVEMPTGTGVSPGIGEFAEVVSDLGTDSIEVVEDVTWTTTMALDDITIGREARTVTNKSVWDAEIVAGDPVTLEPGAEKTVAFDFSREEALLAGVKPESLEDADIVEQWLYDGDGNELLHALLQPLAEGE
jgi:hypothetical protein